MLRTISQHTRLQKGYIPWDETKEAKKNVNISAWTQFYHKPYQDDWKDARQQATERKWSYERI